MLQTRVDNEGSARKTACIILACCCTLEIVLMKVTGHLIRKSISHYVTTTLRSCVRAWCHNAKDFNHITIFTRLHCGMNVLD